MNPDATLLLAPLLIGAVYGWRELMRRYDASVSKRETCKHLNGRREGEKWSRTFRCPDCGHQHPVKQNRCPKCREWSDFDEV